MIEVAKLEIEGGTDGAGLLCRRVGQNTLTGTVDATLADLTAFSEIAGRPLAGALTARAALTGDPARKAVSAEVDLRTQRARALDSPPSTGRSPGAALQRSPLAGL